MGALLRHCNHHTGASYGGLCLHASYILCLIGESGDSQLYLASQARAIGTVRAKDASPIAQIRRWVAWKLSWHHMWASGCIGTDRALHPAGNMSECTSLAQKYYPSSCETLSR